MKLNLIKKSGQVCNITKAVTKIEWSGSASSAARQLSFDYVNAPYDNFGLPEISTGDMVAFEYGQAGEVFYGQIFGTERSSAVGTITYTAFDMMKNLLESSGQYNFKNLPPETIAKMVCDDAQIPIRFLYPTGVNVASLICDDMTLYDIIMAAYTKAHKITGDKYFPMIYKRGLGVYKTHWVVKDLILSENSNLSEASIEETMDNIVNKVKIYDDDGKQIGEVKDDNSLALYGTYQKIYKKEKNIDPNTAAEKKLKIKPDQLIKIKAVGDINCLSCYYVTVKDTSINVSGKYWIKSDKHTWENDAYTMELELCFEAVMDKKDVADDKTAETKSGSGKSSSGSTSISSASSGSNMKPVTQKHTGLITYANGDTSSLTWGRSGKAHGGGARKFDIPDSGADKKIVSNKGGGTSTVYTGRSGNVHGGGIRKFNKKGGSR